MVQSLDDARRRSAGAAGARVPPHNLEAEEALLGAMLVSRDAVFNVVGQVTDKDFYKPAHGHVFDAIMTLNAAGEPVDAVTVAEELNRSGLLEAIGGPGVVVGLLSRGGAIGSAAHYAKIVAEHAILRRMIGAAAEISELGYSLPEDVRDALDRAEQIMFDVATVKADDNLHVLKDLFEASLDRMAELYEVGSEITGVPTGYHDLDKMLAGLQPSNLVIVGARPAVGKSAFALGMALHAAMEGVPTLFCSLEMDPRDLAMRLISAQAKIDSTRMRSGRLEERDWSKMVEAIGKMASAPLHIDDNPGLTVLDVRAKARRLMNEGLGLIVIDYLQLMRGRANSESRQVEISEISRSLKVLARELKVPIVALFQLSRRLEERADKRPMLSDLRESGGLEQDADVVLFLYRDEVHHEDSPEKGIAEVIVAKHRNGQIGKIKLAFLSNFAAYHNLQAGYE